MSLKSKEINTLEAEKIITEFNKPKIDSSEKSEGATSAKNKSKLKKISKK